MRTLTRLTTRLNTIKELFAFFWHQRLWWLMPMMIIFLLFGLLLIFVQGSVFAPFIYTLF